MQTDANRFGHTNVDDRQGRVNDWRLDEGLIDYGGAADENQYVALAVIAKQVFRDTGSTGSQTPRNVTERLKISPSRAFPSMGLY